VLIAVVGLIPAMAFSQPIIGTPPFGSFAGGPDTINLANLNVHWTFPILSKPGRGLPLNYALNYDSSIWVEGWPNGPFAPPSWIPQWAPGQPVASPISTWGWQPDGSALTGYVSYFASTAYSCGPGGCHPCGTKYNYWGYTDPAGTTHGWYDPETNRNFTAYSPSCGFGSTGGSLAFDGSGVQLSVTVTDSGPQVTINLPGGEAINPPQQDANAVGTFRVTDTNGNYISINNDGSQRTFTDTLGTNALTIAGTYPTTYTYSGPNGTSETVTVNYTSYTVATNFGVPGINEYPPTWINLPSSIVYPDGSSYSLSYEPTPGGGCSPIPLTYPSNCITGRIGSVTLPTGGKISYRYNGGSNGIFGDGTTAGFYRDVYDGTSTNTSLYFLSGSGLTTMYDPQGNVTQINFSGLYETQRQVYQGDSTGTLLKTTLNCYNGNFTTCATPPNPVTLPISSKYSYDIFPSGLWDAHVKTFNDNGLPTELDDFDFVVGSFGSPMRREIITYASLGSILNKPASVVVEDGANPPNIFSQTYYYYDQWPLWTPPGTTPQHTSPLQPLQRGNLTEIQMWTGDSNWLFNNIDYYDTGMVHDNRDVNGQPRYFNYADAISTCGNAFPTSITPPTGLAGIDLTTTITYNCDGGVAASTTDANLNSKSITAWDAFWRPTQTKDEMGNVTNTTYTATTVESNLTFNNASSTLDTLTTFDGLGRSHIVQHRQSPNAVNYDSMETDYDALGRPWRTSIPYVAAAGVGYAFSRTAPMAWTAYDALGRQTVVADAGGGSVSYTYTDNEVFVDVPSGVRGQNDERRQYKYDALGRLVSVCELATAASNGTCGLNPAYWGFQTNYTYDAAGRLTGVTQNAQQGAPGSPQGRSFTYDGLGRMLSETNPESGTRTYQWDSANGCGGPDMPGDMVVRRDAAGNVTCNSYDALHRLTQSYSSGPAAGVTPFRGFDYDTGTVNGQTMLNAKGRLTIAYNCFSSCSIVPSVLLFSYSPRGEVTDTWEQTENSGGYYHASQNYWENGAPKQLSNLPGLPAITYGGLDGQGRVRQVTASYGQNPVTGVTYDTSGTTQPLGAVTQVNFGSLDFDQFSYERNSGRLTKYTFNVGSQADVGQLAWNTNGRLAALQISDGITGTVDSQSCNYSYDDLGRMASVNCSTGSMFVPPWSQTFTYDPFGNITKAGSLSFNPGYDTSKNQFISPPNPFFFYPTYDANGNLTWDLMENYSWDAEGKPVIVGNKQLIYDAFGRMVQQSHWSSACNCYAYDQSIVYGPNGSKLALMNGQTLIKAFIPLPGGAKAVYNSSGLQYYRHSDHLGSSRLASTASRGLYYSGAYAPFGESYAESGTTDRSFTGNNEDTVPGLADFMFREYSSAQQGRFISPDPLGRTAANPTDPQTWNRYAYVGNRPLTNIDPLGLDFEDGVGCGDDWYDAGNSDECFGVSGMGSASGSSGVNEKILDDSLAKLDAALAFDPRRLDENTGPGNGLTDVFETAGLAKEEYFNQDTKKWDVRNFNPEKTYEDNISQTIYWEKFYFDPVSGDFMHELSKNTQHYTPTYTAQPNALPKANTPSTFDPLAGSRPAPAGPRNSRAVRAVLSGSIPDGTQTATLPEQIPLIPFFTVFHGGVVTAGW
jgi:RHS repeat-associated protein